MLVNWWNIALGKEEQEVIKKAIVDRSRNILELLPANFSLKDDYEQ
ncbi:hypothetical protein [Helicobacter sp.]|nr:hypothetical protein [Helicobacter sp.]MCI5968209.1 hypothetical protein [Helicobacter sp.]MDY2584362.1 hypothetical protein [Helicobacter sp.]